MNQKGEWAAIGQLSLLLLSATFEMHRESEFIDQINKLNKCTIITKMAGCQ